GGYGTGSAGAGVAAGEHGCVLATAGADSAIRLWDLGEWLAAHMDGGQTGNLKNGMPPPSSLGSCGSRGCGQPLGPGLVVRTAWTAYGGLVEQIIRFKPRPPPSAVQSPPPDPLTGMQGRGRGGDGGTARKQMPPLPPPGLAAATDGARCLALCGGGDVMLAATYSGAVYLLDLRCGRAAPPREGRPRNEELAVGLAGDVVQREVKLQEETAPTTDPIRAEESPGIPTSSFQSEEADDDAGK
ncbi:hypothetical protein VaNZ11_001268, partial [Volvox africanus]